MRKIHHTATQGFACSVSALALVVAGPAWAQTTTDAAGEPIVAADGECAVDATGAPIATDPDCANVTADAVATPAEGGIVVTGSRIKRDTYSSISPLQVLTSETENEVGLFDPSQILQRSETASGQQIDATFQGFVLDNGPGSQTLNLRGLGADRTLLLLNGRRLAPAGVEGAPSSPSINLLPGSLIDRYELLLDGASSLYGSDAVAGVGNVILRKDYDGLELTARGDINPEGQGEDYALGAAYGVNFDRGFIGIGGEYSYRDAVRLRDRKFFRGCDTNREITSTGEIRTIDVASNARLLRDSGGNVGVSEQPCTLFVGTGAAVISGARLGAVFFQGPNGPGIPGGNTGIPNFSENTNVFGQPVDTDGDGLRDVDFADYNLDGQNLDQTFQSQQKLYNIAAYGEYILPGAANITPFFEANFFRAEIFSANTGRSQIAAFVPANNAFNPCNISNPNGVDCSRASNIFNGLLPGTPFARFADVEGRNLAVQPFFAIRGDRNNVDVQQDQYRGVLGVKGDMPFLAPGWSFEVSGVYSRSEGKSRRLGIREDKLAFALGIDPTADFTGDGVADNTGDGVADEYNRSTPTPPLTGGACNAAGLRNPGLALPDLTQGCVPVNLFAPSIFGQPFGDFATQAERDYVFGEKNFDTVYEQVVVNAFVTGDIFNLPAGPVGAVLGLEYRNDRIDSQPDVITANGLLIQQNSDLGASGSKWIREAFAEIDFPLQADKPWVRELNANLSGRVTDEEFYGTNFTYSAKGLWRPIEPLAIKISYGTSFRAPNLRENFLAGQTGFLTLTDPCAVPDAAFDSLAGGYQPDEDTRDPAILANCRREGRDPTSVGIGPGDTSPFQSQSVSIVSGGSLDIDPENSRSLTAGFAFEETFGDGYDVSIALNYFDIQINGAIVEPSSQFIINDCFGRTDGTRSAFCDRVTANTGPTNPRGLVNSLDSGFINLNRENVRGLDINTDFGKELSVFGTVVDFGLNLRANHLIERSSVFVDDDGNPSFDEDAGEFGLPKWTGRGTFTADIDKFRFTYAISYTGPVEQQADGINPLSDAFGRGPDGAPTGFIGDTCLGNGSGTYSPTTGVFTPDGVVAGDGVFCRDIGFAKEQFLHSASIRYQASRYTLIAGVRNLFDTAPPLVDPNEVFSIANTAIGSGYDYDGREFFASVRYEF